MFFDSLSYFRRHDKLCLAIWLCLASGSVLATPAADSIRQALQAGQLEQAFRLVQQERQRNPGDVHVRFLEGVVQAQQGQTDKAIEVFRKLVESNPEIVEAHNNLGVLYASKGRLDEARKALETGMHAHASFAILHRNLDDVQSQLTKQTYAKALQVDNKARTATPQLSLLGSLTERQPMPLPRTVLASASPGATAAPAPATAPSVPAPAAPPVAPTAAAPASAPAAAPGKPAVSPGGSTPAPVAPAAAVPGPQAAPAAPSRPAVAEPAQAEAVRHAVQAWAQAWARKDMDGYLQAYADSFTPAERLSRSKWEAERRQRILSKKSISVEVRQLKVTVEGASAKAQFQQIYTSDNFTGNSRKTLDMVRQGERWLITRETVN